MKILLAFARTVDELNERVGRAVSWLVLAAVLVSAGNAVLRYTLNLSSNAWLEIQWYLFSAGFLVLMMTTSSFTTYFLALGATVWWHTRPRALLTAALLLLAGFLAITIRPQWLPNAPQLATGPWLAWVVGWQIVLGLALGLVYAASLYFGMVLSEGSTEHGGYHEALIGVGSVLGPGAGALVQWMYPGKAWVSVAAVGSVIGLTLVTATLASIRAKRRG